MKRIITSAAACAIALGTVAAPAHAATCYAVVSSNTVVSIE